MALLKCCRRTEKVLQNAPVVVLRECARSEANEELDDWSAIGDGCGIVHGVAAMLRIGSVHACASLCKRRSNTNNETVGDSSNARLPKVAERVRSETCLQKSLDQRKVVRFLATGKVQSGGSQRVLEVRVSLPLWIHTRHRT